MKKRITAGELLAELNADPEFVAARARDDQERLAYEAEFRRAEAPLVAELRSAGFQVESAWDLINAPGSYRKALPILLEHLEKPYPSGVREGIARALGVPDASYAWNALTRLYRDEPDHDVKDGLAAAIAGVANDDLIGDVISLARDPSHGGSRLLLLSALEHSPDPRARAALLDLATDPDLTLEIQDIFKRFARKQARRAKRAEQVKQAKPSKPAKR